MASFHKCRLVLCALALLGTAAAQTDSYSRLGNKADVRTASAFGVALMGGGRDLDEAFRWLCDHANGGDFLVLSAVPGDEYNAYVAGLCHTNSVATLVIPDRQSAQDRAVAALIRQAEALFITGGDQSRYVNFWSGTPVQAALNEAVAAGIPIGGTSAGLAVLGQFAYSAQGDTPDDKNLNSRETLANPFHPRITIVRDFLRISLLRGVITDSHFARRDRLGRTLAFLARLSTDLGAAHPRAIGVDERSAVLLDRTGSATVLGDRNGAYFLRPRHKPEKCLPGAPLTFTDVAVHHAPAGSSFDLKQWRGEGGNDYTLSVKDGAISSSNANKIY